MVLLRTKVKSGQEDSIASDRTIRIQIWRQWVLVAFVLSYIRRVAELCIFCGLQHPCI